MYSVNRERRLWRRLIRGGELHVAVDVAHGPLLEALPPPPDSYLFRVECTIRYPAVTS